MGTEAQKNGKNAKFLITTVTISSKWPFVFALGGLLTSVSNSKRMNAKLVC